MSQITKLNHRTAQDSEVVVDCIGCGEDIEFDVNEVGWRVFPDSEATDVRCEYCNTLNEIAAEYTDGIYNFLSV